MYVFVKADSAPRYAIAAETELISPFQRLIAELNKEQEAFIASKQTGEKVEAVAPWVGAPNEDALREECLSLSTVSNSSCVFLLLLHV